MSIQVSAEGAAISYPVQYGQVFVRFHGFVDKGNIIHLRDAGASQRVAKKWFELVVTGKIEQLFRRICT